MKAIELYTKEGVSTGVFYCSECKCVHRTQEQAESCCLCDRCKTAKRDIHYIYCAICKSIVDNERNLKRQITERAILDKAKEVTKWEYVWFNEKMYSNLEELIEDCEYDETPIPEYVHAMKPIKFWAINPEYLIDNYNENIEISDDCYNIKDHIQGLDELYKAFNVFNEKNKDMIIYWQEDTAKKVKVVKNNSTSII